VHPRVLLSPQAVNVWLAPGRVESTLCINDGDDLIVNVLQPYYLRETAAGLRYEGYFQNLRNRINLNLTEMPLGSPERSKWEWIVGFFNNAIVRHGIDVPPFDTLPMPTRD
jgi:hypothetical protein